MNPSPPPTAARRARQSPRSVVTTLTSVTASQKEELDSKVADEEDSFLAGFSPSLKLSDVDDWTADFESGNPFREAKVAAAAPTQTASAQTTASAAATTYQFENYFESNDPFEETALSDYHVSEATTAVGSNLLSNKLLSNMHDSNNVAPPDSVSPEPLSPPKKVRKPAIHSSNRFSSSELVFPPKNVGATEMLSPKKVLSPAPAFPSKKVVEPEIHSSKKVTATPENVVFVTPKNSPRQSKHTPVDIHPLENRKKAKEDLKRRSRAHRSKEDRNREEDFRRGHSRRTSSYVSDEESSLPSRDDGSTICDTETYGSNSLTYRDNSTYFTEDDSFTLRDGDDDTFLTPIPSSRRSRYYRRGGGTFLCGCDDVDTIDMADTVKGALKDLNRTMKQIFSPRSKARRYPITRAKSHYDSVREQPFYDDRPTRSRSQHVTRRSRSISVRRERTRSLSTRRRGKSCDPPRVIEKKL